MTLNPLPDLLWEYLQNKYQAEDAQIVSGGSINEAAKFSSKNGSFFVKWNDATAFPKMFELEAQNLDLIRSTNTINVPNSIEAHEISDIGFLILEFVQTQKKSFIGFEKLGEKLALMHRNSNEEFGLSYNNYIGIVHQSNKSSADWADFFVENRLKPLANEAYRLQLLTLEEMALFVTLYQRIPTLFPPEKPALLHGDLWNGNFLIAEKDVPYVFDPATYYGHREMDIAMTTLFGGFDRVFYDAYHATFPLEKDWQERIALWNIYPLLIHLLLFGNEYHRDLIASVKKYL